MVFAASAAASDRESASASAAREAHGHAPFVHGAWESRLDHAAPAECPSDTDFREAIRARLSSPPSSSPPSPGPASEPAPAPQYRVQIQWLGAAGYEGALLVDDPVAGTHGRRLSAAACAELSDALAFLTALAIELEGRPGELPETDLPIAPPIDADASAGMGPAATGTAAGRERLASAPRARFSAALAVGLRGGVRPALAPTVDSYAVWSFGTTRTWTSVLAGAVVAPLARTTVAEASARLGLIAGRFAVCPWSRALAYGVSIAPCAGFELGVLPSYGAAGDARSGFPLWFAAELGLVSRWMPAGSAFFVEAQAKALFAVQKSRSYFGPADTTIYVASAIVGATLLGAGIAF